MSTPQAAAGGPAVEKDKSKRRSIQRFVSKIIKTTKSKKTEPTEAAPAESSSASAPGPITAPPATEATKQSMASDVVHPPSKTTPTVENASTHETGDLPKPDPDASVVAELTKPRTTMLPLGARQLAEKHGIEIEDWPYPARPSAGERIEKPIRMRVRRYCHICQTSFGSEKSCPSCGHKRCVECPRSPPSKTDRKKTKSKHKEYDPYEGLTMPSKTGGQPLVYRKIRQRVHYKCHKCESDFAGQKTCPQCSHNRCKKCHREPNRKPAPAEEAKRKKPVRWTCSVCHTGANAAKTCSSCSHPRCVDCVRETPRKKKKKVVLPPEFASETDTREGVSLGHSDIDKVSSALAATSIS